ncbi:hypothetical protein EXIGLDRAFT_493510 [Exidia glandulosa HHB12029]|uniref:Uncharacterized protein n=1 Tax=Exidia glandulosa HHB12029 TaxID=1314781 RepID=A0A166NAV5_EXIGL|nr:hypothetical protein EXIGLDRAFT_493510 [Exidia glandulosa HHB12029]
MLVRAKDYVRSTLASHEKTRRLAELATDAVCGATESVVDNYGAWIPLGWVARDAAGVFRREAFDVLQAPYASLKTSVNTLEGLIPHLRLQLTTIETELFEARARAHVLEQQLRDEEAHVQYLQLERTNAVQRGRELERSLRGGGEERMGRVLVEEEMERVRALEGRRDEMQRAIDALRSASEHGHGLSTPPTSERDIVPCS